MEDLGYMRFSPFFWIDVILSGMGAGLFALLLFAAFVVYYFVKPLVYQ
jgi:hypothetical protein